MHQVELWSLVLQATSIRHRIAHGNEGFELLVEEEDFSAAKHQLDIFEVENQDWPPIAPQIPTYPASEWFVVVFAAVLVGFYCITGPWASNTLFFANGAVHAGRIINHGEWWRVLTALFLHADAVHLLGNVCLGSLLISYLCQQVGFGVAGGMVLLSGAFGNLLNVWFHQGNHQSVGFSTAVFGTLGALCGLRLMSKELSVKNVLMALGAGIALLAMLGVEGERTDLGAHFWGLIVGGILGASIQRTGRLQEKMIQLKGQGAIAIFSLAVICGAWYVSLHKGI